LRLDSGLVSLAVANARRARARASDSAPENTFITRRPPRRHQPFGDGHRRLRQAGGAGGVAVADAAELRRHVGEDDVDAAAAALAQLFEDGRLGGVAHHGRDPGLRQRLDRHQVDADDDAARPDQLRGDLQPAPWPGAQVDDVVAAPDELIPPRQLEQLVRRPRAVALGLGARVECVLALICHRPPLP